MQQNPIWLSISLFCNKEYWHILLDKGISPFLKDTSAALLLKAYQLEFNYNSGENIRLKLLTEEGSAELLTAKADKYFRHFFQNNGLTIRNAELPINKLFMPFASNTIRYGLYTIPAAGINFKNYQLEKGLSLIMAEVFKGDIIDDEKILTLGFYLHTGVLKLLKRYKLESAFQQIAPAPNITNSELSLQAQYLEIKPMLLKIYKSIMDQEDYSNTPWLKTWMDLCEEEIKQQVEFTAATYDFRIHTPFISLIQKHIGINNHIDLLLKYFIKQVIIDNEHITVQ